MGKPVMLEREFAIRLEVSFLIKWDELPTGRLDKLVVYNLALQTLRDYRQFSLSLGKALTLQPA